MKLTVQQLQELAALAEQAASKAVAIIRSFRNKELELSVKDSNLSEAASVVTQVDLKCQEGILATLRDSITTYELGLLTEELQDDQSRLKKDYFWCIDPLDGTLPFTENQPGYAVSIALVARNGMPVIGVVHDPVTNVRCTAVLDQGVTWSPSKPAVDSTTAEDLVCCFDRSFLKHHQYTKVVAALERMKEALGFKKVHVKTGAGSVMNAMTGAEAPARNVFQIPQGDTRRWQSMGLRRYVVRV